MVFNQAATPPHDSPSVPQPEKTPAAALDKAQRGARLSVWEAASSSASQMTGS